MRFHIGSIPESPDFAPDEAWRPLAEPSPWMAQLYALPIAIVSTGIVVALWLLLTPLHGDISELSVLCIVITYAITVVLHELIHAAVHPAAGCSSRTIVGFWPSKLAFYAHYDGELTRNRFIAILLMPFIVISVLPMAVAAIMQVSTVWIALVSSLNAALSCVDLLGTGMMLFQVPKGAIARNQGWRTYWRERRTTDARQNPASVQHDSTR